MQRTLKPVHFLLLLIPFTFFIACKKGKTESKGFAISAPNLDDKGKPVDGVPQDSLVLKTRPSNVLITGYPRYRLTTIYKVNFNRKTEKTYIGSNSFLGNYMDEGMRNGNSWHYNLIPGLEAVYGYNMVNVSLFDHETKTSRNFFEKPVLVKNFYYPASTRDTLNFEPVLRNYYMVSVYDEDTNQDHYINDKDLRRLYLFDMEGNPPTSLVPKNYSVFKSEYDPANDYMYVFAKLDENENGQRDDKEAIHIFWIDMKEPNNNGRQY